MLFFQPWVARFQRETARNTVFPNPTRILHHETRRVGRGGGGEEWIVERGVTRVAWDDCVTRSEICVGRLEVDDGGGRAVVESKFLRAINFGEVVWRRRGNFVRGKNEEEGNMKIRGRDYGLEFVFDNFNSNLWSWKEIEKCEDFFKFNSDDSIFGWKFRFKSSVIIRYNKLILKCEMNKV